MTIHQTVPDWPDVTEWPTDSAWPGLAEWDESADETGPPGPASAALAAAGPAERAALVEEYLRHEIARVLHTDPALVDTGRPLHSVGIGSMMGVELQHRVQDALAVELDLPTVLRAGSTTELAQHVGELLATTARIG